MAKGLTVPSSASKAISTPNSYHSYSGPTVVDTGISIPPTLCVNHKRISLLKPLAQIARPSS